MRHAIMKKIVVFFVISFLQSVSLLYAMKISLFKPGGECKITLPGNFQIGTVVSLTLSCTPSEDGEAGSMQVALNLKGLEFVDLSAPVPGAWARILWKGKVSKGAAITKQMSFKVTRPGVWDMTGGFSYGPVAPESELGYAIKYGMGQHLYLVATDQGVATYEKQDDIPKEAYTIPSSMTLDYFEHKGKKEGKHLTAYLPKETRLDFEPTYPFKVSYGAHGNSSADPSKLNNTPQWRVEGNIGTVDNTGLFTATKFGEGKVCVKHSVLEDCLDVEVVPLPNPSPPDKIVDIVVVPYEAEEEKALAKQILSSRKGKKFKNFKDVDQFKDFTREKKKEKYPYVIEYRWQDKEQQYTAIFTDEKSAQDATILKNKVFEKNYLFKIKGKVNTSLHFIILGIAINGDVMTEAKDPANVLQSSIWRADTYEVVGNVGIGEISFTPTKAGIYELRDVRIEVQK